VARNVERGVACAGRGGRLGLKGRGKKGKGNKKYGEEPERRAGGAGPRCGPCKESLGVPDAMKVNMGLHEQWRKFDELLCGWLFLGGCVWVGELEFLAGLGELASRKGALC